MERKLKKKVRMKNSIGISNMERRLLSYTNSLSVLDCSEFFLEINENKETNREIKCLKFKEHYPKSPLT